jgi:hypothetical protein
VAVALLVAVGRAVLLLRRPVPPRPHKAATAAWTVAGAAPLLALLTLVGPGRLRRLLTWVPDAFIAAAAATVLSALRLTLAVRAHRRTP